MTDKVKQTAPVIWEQIQKAKSILLHCHPGPDPDSIGSTLAMTLALESVGKKVTPIIGDSEAPNTINFFPGHEKIILKNYFEIDLSQFDLFITQDSSSKEMISKRAPVEIPNNLTTIIIDHHKSNTEYGDINLVDYSYPACCQIIYDLLSTWKVTLTPEIALNLLMGIYSDTGGFQYAPTDASTFEAASNLVRIAPDYHKAIFNIENNYSPKQIYYRALALSSIELFFNGKVAIACVPWEKFKTKNLGKNDASKAHISNTLSSVVGWEIGIEMKEDEPGNVGISMRTRGKYIVGQIATSLPGGGGHPMAGGASLKMPFADAKKLLLETIQKIYPELGNP